MNTNNVLVVSTSSKIFGYAVYAVCRKRETAIHWARRILENYFAGETLNQKIDDFDKFNYAEIAKGFWVSMEWVPLEN